ncbi:MAG: hypothetical protein KAH18_13280 [Psychromonas sp.]|nr:hypothetical protein [Psychromonas sp.]
MKNCLKFSNIFKKKTVKPPEIITSSITIMFKSAGGPGFSGCERIRITESLNDLIFKSAQAVLDGDKSLNTEITADDMTRGRPRKFFEKYEARVNKWFGKGGVTPHYIHEGVLKVHGDLINHQKLLTFIDVRCSDDRRRYDADDEFCGINRTQPPRYEKDEVKIRPPSYMRAALKRRPRSYIEAITQTRSNLIDLGAENSIIHPLEMDHRQLIDKITSADISRRHPIEFTGDLQCFETDLISGLHIYVQEDMISYHIKNDEIARIIYHDLAMQILFLQHNAQKGDLHNSKLIKKYALDNPFMTRHFPGCWSFFITSYKKSPNDHPVYKPMELHM